MHELAKIVASGGWAFLINQSFSVPYVCTLREQGLVLPTVHSNNVIKTMAGEALVDFT